MHMDITETNQDMTKSQEFVVVLFNIRTAFNDSKKNGAVYIQ